MKILILGSKGMLGGYLQEVFKNQEVTAWDREDLDITLPEALENKIQKLEPDVIINSAAYNEVDKAEEQVELANLLNGQAPGYIVRAATEAGATFVHYSTNFIFDGTNEEGYEEDAEANPQSAYASSKYLGEKLILDQAQKHPELDYYILRTSYLFGRTGTSELAKKGFTDFILDKAEKGEEIKVVDDEIGCHTYALDLAKRTREILEFRKDKGIYHAVNSGACSWYDFAKELLSIKEIDAKLTLISQADLGRPASRPQTAELLNTKLPPMRSWQEALADFLKEI